MKRKKKKKSTQYVKQKAAEAKKSFLRSLKSYLELFNCGHIYNQIPQKHLECLYDIRVRTPKIICGKGCHVDQETFNRVNSYISSYIRTKRIEIMSIKQSSATILQHLTIGLSFFLYFESSTEQDFPGFKQLKEEIDKNYNYEDTFIKLQKALINILGVLSAIESDINNKLYFIQAEFTKHAPINYYIKINYYKNIAEKIKIDGVVRDIYPVGWAREEGTMDWATISTDLNLAEKPLKVYIQSHAIDRLNERLDSITPGIAQLVLYTTLKEPVITFFNKKILIEYNIEDNKAGYLVVHITDDKAIIRTFLFLTNSGTPEGQKLEKLSGLKKVDKQYWAIDKLSTFQVSDLAENKELRELFEEAGCGSLFKIDCIDSNYENINLNIAEKIEKYIHKPLPLLV